MQHVLVPTMSQPSTTAYENPVSGVTGAEVVAGDILLSSALGGDTVSVGGAAGWVFPTTRSWGAMSALAPRTTPEDSEGALVTGGTSITGSFRVELEHSKEEVVLNHLPNKSQTFHLI